MKAVENITPVQSAAEAPGVRCILCQAEAAIIQARAAAQLWPMHGP